MFWYEFGDIFANVPILFEPGNRFPPTHSSLFKPAYSGEAILLGKEFVACRSELKHALREMNH